MHACMHVYKSGCVLSCLCFHLIVIVIVISIFYYLYIAIYKSETIKEEVEEIILMLSLQFYLQNKPKLY